MAQCGTCLASWSASAAMVVICRTLRHPLIVRTHPRRIPRRCLPSVVRRPPSPAGVNSSAREGRSRNAVSRAREIEVPQANQSKRASLICVRREWRLGIITFAAAEHHATARQSAQVIQCRQPTALSFSVSGRAFAYRTPPNGSVRFTASYGPPRLAPAKPVGY